MDPDKSEDAKEKTPEEIVKNLPRVKECLDQFQGKTKATIVIHLVDIYNNTDSSSLVEILAQVLPLYEDDAGDLAEYLTNWKDINAQDNYEKHSDLDRDEINERLIKIYQFFANKKVISWYKKIKNQEMSVGIVIEVSCALDFSFEVAEALVNTSLEYEDDHEVMHKLRSIEGPETAEEFVKYAELFGSDTFIEMNKNYPHLYLLEPV